MILDDLFFIAAVFIIEKNEHLECCIKKEVLLNDGAFILASMWLSKFAELLLK